MAQTNNNGHLSVERVNRFTNYCEIIDVEGRGLAVQEQGLKIAQKLLKNGWGCSWATQSNSRPNCRVN